MRSSPSPWGGSTRSVAALFPTSSFGLFGVRVGYDQVFVVGIAVAVAIALTLFFRATQLGLQTQAVVGDRNLTGLVGVDAKRVTTCAWVLGTVLAGLAGVLFAPLVGLDAVLLTLLVVQAFALLGTLVGGFTIAIGVGPQTTADIAFHLFLIALLLAGFVVLYKGAKKRRRERA